MPVSLEELLGATQYRSLSRTGRTTDSVSSKARLHFQQSILKRKTAAEDAAMGKKREVNPLKLLTVSEVVDTDQEAQRLQKSIPADLQDERVDLLVSSAREHPEVERKGQYIVTLEREIAFHHAMSPFHKGVDTSASLQAADVVARKRAEAERIEQERQQHAFEEAGTKPSPPGSPLQSPSKRMKDSNKSSHSFVSERALTPSPAFASKSGRFAKPENSQAPPVGHYRPRHNVVDVAAPAPAFPKHKRILNPVLPSSYVGDKMTMEEREQAILNMSRPGTVAASVPVSPNMKSSFIHSSEKLLSASTPPVSPKNGLAASTSPSSPTGGSMGSPCFKSPGRDTVAMTRGGAATPEPTKKGKKGRPSSPDRPDAVSDHLIRPRERGVLEMHRQLGRPPITALGMSAITDTTKMPLRTGDALFGNGAKGHALSFDAHASREQRNRCTEMKPEQLAQRFYDRSALDHIKYSRTPVHEFNRSPIRGRGDTSPTRDSHSRTGGDSHLLTGSTVPELPRTHTPGFKMELSPARRGVEIPMHDVQYEIHDDIIRPNTRQAVIAPPSSNRSPLRIQPGTTPSSPAQGLSAAPDSPVVRRKYIRDISLAKQVSREAVERITHHDKEPDPIPAERVERALNYTRPAAKALVPIGTVVSREKRDLMGSPERLTVNIDTNCGSADTSQLANLKLGYVQFGKMSDRDHQGGNKFANDIRSLTKLFEDGSQRRDRGGPVSPSNRRTRSEASPPPPASPSH